jgi:PAS domain S-box-containing protein
MRSTNNKQTGRKTGFKQSELKLMQKMFEHATISICILEGSDHKIKYMNKSFSRLLGRQLQNLPEQLSAEGLMRGTRRDEAMIKSRLDMLDRLYSTGEALVIHEYKTEYDRNASGKFEEAYFNVIYQPLLDTGGSCYGIFVAGFEVTDQVKYREHVIQSEQRMSLALKGAQMGFWEFDIPSNSFKYVSENLLKHFGYYKEEKVTFEQLMSKIHPEDRPIVEQKIQEGMTKTGQYEMEYRVIWPDGTMRWLRGHGNCLFDEKGQPYRRTGISMDITHRKEAEQALKEAVQLRDDFLSIASHELQTPITSIKARTEIFERQLLDNNNKSYARHAHIISERIDQLSRLTGSLLDVSRLEEGKLVLNKQEVSLDSILDETLEVFRRQSRRSLEVTGLNETKVYADRFRIRQVLVNIIENAIKYSPQGAPVRVDVSKPDDGVVCIAITDHGMGIDEGDKKSIFKRFYKGSNSQLKSYPGFGIGLYISAQIVRRHGGRIWVEDNPAGGSVFKFTVPTSEHIYGFGNINGSNEKQESQNFGNRG